MIYYFPKVIERQIMKNDFAHVLSGAA